ncbi:MAG: hypothetical protein AAGB12_11610 [Pseudomonadota bacterium]
MLLTMPNILEMKNLLKDKLSQSITELSLNDAVSMHFSYLPSRLMILCKVDKKVFHLMHLKSILKARYSYPEKFANTKIGMDQYGNLVSRVELEYPSNEDDYLTEVEQNIENILQLMES